MCLDILKKLKVTVTQRDLTVYKILQKVGDNYESPIYSSQWNIGREQYIEPSDILNAIEFYEKDLFSVTKGLYAYTTKTAAKAELKRWSHGNSSTSLCLGEMLIPEGAIVIKGGYHEIVANIMKLIKVF